MGKWHLSMDPVQEWGEEEEDGAVFGITLRREAAPAEPDSPDSADSAAAATAPACGFVQYHTVKVRRLKAASLERLVAHLLDPQRQEPDFLPVFLSTYRAFTSAAELIQLLFQRDDANAAAALDGDSCPRSTLPPVVRRWLDEHADDFREPPRYAALRLLCLHLQRRLCFRRLAQSADATLRRLQEQDGVQPASELAHESPPPPPPPPDGGELRSFSFADFSARDVAEQLTRLDADLFVKVVPFHCTGCVWSQRDKKENRHLAPTVRATICQFNAVTNRVITSLLCPAPPSPGPPTSSSESTPSSSNSAFTFPSTAPSSPRCSHAKSPAHRARLIERWIAVAQECRDLKNFSSLRAILSALQSNAVYRLKKTWSAVCRDSMNTFDHLCDTFPDENCVLISRETLDQGSGSGVVPYLGTYLTVLTMLDTALTDTVEGGLINFEKRRREFEILSQIRQLQSSCSHYDLPAKGDVAEWLQNHTLLSDQDSYDLSRDLEPPVDPCPNSPNSWSSRLITKKLATLRPSQEATPRKTHADQISVSSSGSSSSDMDDLAAPQPSLLRLKLKSFSGSLHDVAEDLSSASSASSPSLSGSSCSSSHPDLSSASLLLSPESPSPPPSSGSSPQASLPVYNKQVADSCIIRVSVESVCNGNVYKSILLRSHDHTPQVVQRALEKHNMDDVQRLDFSLFQKLHNGKELQIPDKANVFYAMCTNANYDFVLRRRWRSHGRHSGSASSSSSSPGAPPRSRHAHK